MKVTRHGHAAILVETDGERILVDPGSFSDSWHDLTGLTAVLVTHQHADHVDPAHLVSLVRNNPDARVVVEESVLPRLADEAVEAAPARPGETLTFGSTRVEVVGGRHAIIHDKIPRVGNVGFVFSDGDGPRLYHPGDSYEYPLEKIDVLALPVTAPWARAATTADFLAAVAPTHAFPIHDAIVSQTGWNLYLRLARELGGEGVDLHPVGPTESLDF